MTNLFSKAACLLLIGGVVGVTAVVAQEPSGSQAPAPDNTKMNERDRNQAATTADQQSGADAPQQDSPKARELKLRTADSKPILNQTVWAAPSPWALKSI